jgi:hypothetical protein
VSADQPLTGDELAAIKNRLHAAKLSLARLNHVQNVNFARLNIAVALDDEEALVVEVERLGEIVEHYRSESAKRRAAAMQRWTT